MVKSIFWFVCPYCENMNGQSLIFYPTAYVHEFESLKIGDIQCIEQLGGHWEHLLAAWQAVVRKGGQALKVLILVTASTFCTWPFCHHHLLLVWALSTCSMNGLHCTLLFLGSSLAAVLRCHYVLLRERGWIKNNFCCCLMYCSKCSVDL